MTRVLVVEDNAGYRDYLLRFLETLGFEPIYAADALAGLQLAVDEQPRLMLVDWCLRGKSGLELVRTLRGDSRTRHIPLVLMSSIKETVEDEVRALGAGADRFFVKEELEPGFDNGAGLKRHLSALVLLGESRTTPSEGLSEKIYRIGDLRLDSARGEASVAGRPIHLGRKELELLEFFLRHPEVIHSAEKIWRSVWNTPRVGNWEHTLAATLSSLRKNLGFEWSARLVNTKSLGYRLLSAGPSDGPNSVKA